MKNLVKNFIKIKFNFEIPNKNKYLIFDKQSEKILSRIINDDYVVLPTRLEKISLIILFYSLILNFKESLRLKNIYFNYLKTYIKVTQPSYVITFIDNDKRFFKFKRYLNNIKFIAVQNGYRFFKNDLFELIEKSKYTFQCDYYYCFGDNVKNYLKNKIQSNFHCIGSLKNNFCKKEIENYKKNICFISSYGISTNIAEVKILQSLYKLCLQKEIKLEILARTNSNNEEIFFSKILYDKEFIYHKQTNDFCSSYKILDSAMIAITLNSTLGYENLSRNNKTFFININDRNLNCTSFLKFGYPEEFEDEGFFWTNKFESKTIERINYIYQLSETEWENKTSKIIKRLIVYDGDNQSLINRLHRI